VLRSFITTLSLGLAALSLAALFLVLQASPSNDVLEADLKEIAVLIQKAEAEAVNYSGGAIQAIIAARRQVLRLTQDALKQKRQTVLRRIDLKITFDAKAVPVASIEDLRAIELDIAAQESKAAAARAEADRYSGGLLQSLALMKAATEEFSTATLRMKLYTSKYGIGLPLAPEGAVEAKPAPAGKVVKDRDAL
jgi:hypothetical protein